jgi:hypothetical protein
MKFLRTISKVRPFVKTLSGLKQIIRKGSGVVMPKLSKMHISSITTGGKIKSTPKPITKSIKPLKFLI